MMEFAAGLLIGSIITFAMLTAMDATPLAKEQKLCAEADWKLPSCIAALDQAVNKAKGVKQ